jgi:hypothetical protein
MGSLGPNAPRNALLWRPVKLTQIVDRPNFGGAKKIGED